MINTGFIAPFIFIASFIFILPGMVSLSSGEDALSENSLYSVSKYDAKGKRGILKTYLSDASEILTSTEKWEKKDWLEGTFFLTAAGALYSQDEKIRDWTADNKSDGADNVLAFAKDFGDGRYLLPPLGLLWLYGKGWRDGRAKETASLAVESFLISGIFVQVLKGGMRRHRPYMEDGRDHWDGPGADFSGSTLSFPSGHSQTAFSIAAVIADQYKHLSIVPPLAYGLATLVAMQRIYDDKHWASDVLVGSSIGYFTAKKVMELRKDNDSHTYLLVPHLGGEGGGLSLVATF